MNWKLAILAAVMVVGVLGIFFTQIQEGGASDIDYLFVQTAEGGSYAEGVLTLDGVSATVFFSDHPRREVGHTPNEKFAARFGDADDDDDTDDLPGAVLSVHDAEDATAVMAILSTPIVSGQTITYQVEVLEGSITATFGAATLFIDTEGEDLDEDEHDRM